MKFPIIIVTFIVMIKNSVKAKKCGREGYSIYQSEDNALCYWVTERDDLPLIDENKWTEEAIYFIDTSCKGGLNYREACSVEAAAMANPTRDVHVFFTGPIVRKCLRSEPLLSLQKYENVHLKRMYIDDFVRGTNVSDALRKEVVTEGPFPNLYTLVFLKIITLYKFDGIYMDLDMLSTRNFDELPRMNNFFAIEDHSAGSLSSAIFAVSSNNVGRRLVDSAMRVLENSLKSDQWSFENFNGWRIALEQIFGSIPFKKTKIGRSFTKSGLTVYASNFFFPIECPDTPSYFENVLDIKNLTKSFTQQLCSSLTFQIPVKEQSAYAKLMERFCPYVFNHFKRINFKECIKEQ